MGRKKDVGRYAWVDYAKGICIIGVVTLYASDMLREQFGSAGWMEYWVRFARPFRMPDFFLLSGLFLARVIDRQWDDYIDKKVVHYLYFFVLWTVIIFFSLRCLEQIAPLPEALHRQSETVLQWLWEPYGMLWFIHILPIFFLVTRLTKRVPVWLMLGGAVLLQSFPIWGIWGPIGNFCERFVYFYFGYAFAPYVFRLAEWAQSNRAKALLAVITWACINAFLVHIDRSASKGISVILGIVGTGGVVLTGTLLFRYPWMNWLRYLGENSIVTYLGFYVPLVAMVMLVRQHGAPADMGTVAALISVISVLVPHTIFRLVRGRTGSFLFQRPSWVKIPRRSGELKAAPAQTD